MKLNMAYCQIIISSKVKTLLIIIMLWLLVLRQKKFPWLKDHTCENCGRKGHRKEHYIRRNKDQNNNLNENVIMNMVEIEIALEKRSTNKICNTQIEECDEDEDNKTSNIRSTGVLPNSDWPN